MMSTPSPFSRYGFLLFLALVGFVNTIVCVAQPPAPGPSAAIIALKAARMFDGKSKSLITNAVVIVQANKIVDVGSNLTIPNDAKVIDLGDATLSPGFIDAHTHLTSDYSGNYNERRLRNLDLNVSEQAIKSTINARVTVEAGFTTVRDVG